MPHLACVVRADTRALRGERTLDVGEGARRPIVDELLATMVGELHPLDASRVARFVDLRSEARREASG